MLNYVSRVTKPSTFLSLYSELFELEDDSASDFREQLRMNRVRRDKLVGGVKKDPVSTNRRARLERPPLWQQDCIQTSVFRTKNSSSTVPVVFRTTNESIATFPKHLNFL